MKAMLFAAGKGTRLKPLTDTLPKALVPINGRPLIDRAIEKLEGCGVTEIVINVHHFAEKIVEHINSKTYTCTIHFSDESEKLLNTGGGLVNAQELLSGHEPFIAYNVDVISDIDLKEMYTTHLQKNNLATLAVRQRTTSRYLHFTPEGMLCAWENTKTGEKIKTRKCDKSGVFAFSGIHIISPAFFTKVTETGAFSIIDAYLRLSTNENIGMYNHSEGMWFDLGKINELSEIEEILQQKKE